jgi:hypothetical protein
MIRSVAATALAAGLAAAESASLTVTSGASAPIDVRIYGQFLEKPGFAGERGPEAYVDDDGELPPALVQAMADMRIPVVRFPGGTDIDYQDWTDLITGAPNRAETARPEHLGSDKRPVTHRFGIDEYGRLTRKLGWESVLVVNLLDAMARRKPLDKAARHAAGLIAYAVAVDGAALPAGMPDWTAIRRAHGGAPFAVRYVQLGNEWWMERWQDQVEAAGNFADSAARAAWYRAVIIAYADAIRAVAPEVEIICDGLIGRASAEIVYGHPDIRRRVQWLTWHIYAPGPSTDDAGLVRRHTPADWFRAWSAMPGEYGEDGQCHAADSRADLAEKLGYRKAMTEWNWNGWGFERLPKEARAWQLPAALGSAAFLHGLMRDGFAMAHQSLLVGNGWQITALRPTTDGSVRRWPQGQVTDFYRRHAGRVRHASQLAGSRDLGSTPKVGWAQAAPAVAAVDALVTSDDGAWRILAVHRGTEPLPWTITVPMASGDETELHSLLGVEPGSSTHGWLRESVVTVPGSGNVRQVTLPPQSVNVVVIPR